MLEYLNFQTLGIFAVLIVILYLLYDKYRVSSDLQISSNIKNKVTRLLRSSGCKIDSLGNVVCKDDFMGLGKHFTLNDAIDEFCAQTNIVSDKPAQPLYQQPPQFPQFPQPPQHSQPPQSSQSSQSNEPPKLFEPIETRKLNSNPVGTAAYNPNAF